MSADPPAGPLAMRNVLRFEPIDFGLLPRTHRRTRVASVVICLAIGGIVALDLASKPLFHRTPISHSVGSSFPSGNAMAAMGGVAGLILVFGGSAIWKRVLLIIGSAAVAVNGFAVVYLRWHYPSDVL